MISLLLLTQLVMSADDTPPQPSGDPTLTSRVRALPDGVKEKLEKGVTKIEAELAKNQKPPKEKKKTCGCFGDSTKQQPAATTEPTTETPQPQQPIDIETARAAPQQTVRASGPAALNVGPSGDKKAKTTCGC